MSSAPNPQPAPPLDLAQFQGFAPGPWRVMMPTDGVDLEVEDCAKGRRVARVYGIKSWDANSQLIAAAPALLAECVRLREREMTLLGLLHEITEDPDKEFDNGGPIPAYALVVRRDCYDAARAALSSTASEPGAAHE